MTGEARGVLVCGFMPAGVLPSAPLAVVVVVDARTGFLGSHKRRLRAPYGGHTGQPIEYATRGEKGGGDATVDRTAGTIGREVFGFAGECRKLSGRAVVVRGPREAREGEGFDPQFLRRAAGRPPVPATRTTTKGRCP